MNENLQADIFIGDVSDPYYSPKVTRGLVEFKVHHVNGGVLRHAAAQLISRSGEKYPVTVRAHGRLQPNLSMSPAWQPGDFLIRVDGITFEQAQQVHKIVQEPLGESATFLGAIIETSPLEESLLSIRVRPQPYKGIHKGLAELLNAQDQALPVTLQSITPAPPSSTLGRFGDLICVVQGATLEQVRTMNRLRQSQESQ